MAGAERSPEDQGRPTIGVVGQQKENPTIGVVGQQKENCCEIRRL